MPVRMDPSVIGGANSISKAKKKKREPTIPCSAADVLYQEIRMLLGEAVANPRCHIPTEEKLVTIDVFVFGSGGAPFFLLNPLVLFNWNCPQRRRQRSLAIVAHMETMRVKIVKNDRICL